MKLISTLFSVFILPICFIIGCQGSSVPSGKGTNMTAQDIVFVTYVESIEQLQVAQRLVESIREFGGKYHEGAVWIYHPEDIELGNEEIVSELEQNGAEIKPSPTNDRARWFIYGGKPYAAAAAETAAHAENKRILILMDPDTILLLEPEDLILSESTTLAYRPVMHNRSGSGYDKPVDEFWSRIYELAGISEDMLFPMITPTDQQKIRAYFHCGLLSVKPEKGLLQVWARDFNLMINDSLIVEMCKNDLDRRIFLHQNALTGAVLNNIAHDEMIKLSDRYNYPIFFEKQYGAVEPFNSIDDVVTIRCVVSHENMGVKWHEELKGPDEKISWLKVHLNE